MPVCESRDSVTRDHDICSRSEPVESSQRLYDLFIILPSTPKFERGLSFFPEKTSKHFSSPLCVPQAQRISCSCYYHPDHIGRGVQINNLLAIPFLQRHVNSSLLLNSLDLRTSLHVTNHFPPTHAKQRSKL